MYCHFRMVKLSSIVLVWYLFHFCIDDCFAVTDIDCTQESECAEEPVLSSSQTINCWGFNSCSDVTTIRTRNLYARGAYSAYNATNITSGYISNCHGESSCRNIDHLESRLSTVCGGSKSCMNTTIAHDSTAYNSPTIMLNGFKSGAYSRINVYREINIKVRGTLSLYNGNINMYTSAEIVADAAFGLNGANLFCASGKNCTISCYNFGCANISSATGDGNYIIDCSNNFISNILCNTSDDITYSLTIDFEHDLPNELIEALITPNISDDLQSEDKIYLMYQNLSNPNILGKNCGDYRECNYSTLNYDNQAIICSAYQGCQYGSGLLTVNTQNTTLVSDWNLIGIYCGGHSSCRDGDGSTSNNQFMINKLNINNNNKSSWNEFDIHCDGYQTCIHMNLKSSDNLFCSSTQSCYFSTISSMGTIFVTGTRGLHDATVSSTSGNVYCVAYSACYGSVINQTGGNVYAIGRYAIFESIIANEIDNTIIEKIYAFGYKAASKSSISNVKSLDASGYQVLTDCYIIGIRNLYVNGTDALSGGTITTGISINDNSTDSRVVLDIAGTNDNSYSVTCSSGDECFIYCRSNTSCANMILECYGTCYINCKNYTKSSNQCPNIDYGVVNGSTPTQSSTAIPTEFPTTLPSDIPTMNPTQTPSSTPSPPPSLHPSSQPSPQPSQEPSIEPTMSPSVATTDNLEPFNFGENLVVLLNSTTKKHNATNLENNNTLQNEIVHLLKQSSDWVANVKNDQMTIKINQIWVYNGSIDDNCQLENAGDNHDLFYLSWIHFNITFINSEKQHKWGDELEYIVRDFSKRLSETSNNFSNYTIFIS